MHLGFLRSASDGAAEGSHTLQHPLLPRHLDPVASRTRDPWPPLRLVAGIRLGGVASLRLACLPLGINLGLVLRPAHRADLLRLELTSRQIHRGRPPESDRDDEPIPAHAEGSTHKTVTPPHTATHARRAATHPPSYTQTHTRTHTHTNIEHTSMQSGPHAPSFRSPSRCQRRQRHPPPVRPLPRE